MSRTALALFVGGLLMAAPPPAHSQISENAAAAYTALHLTAPAAVAPVAPNLGRQAFSFRAQYGRHRMFDAGTNAYALGVDFPIAARHSAGVTVGRYEPTWDDADGHFFFGAQIAGNLIGLHTPPETGHSIASTYEIQAGFGRSEDTDLIAVTAGIPVALPFRFQQNSLVPFITPAVGWGRWSFEDNQSASGLRFVLSGGAAYEFASGLGIHLGARYVFIENADMLWGAGVTWRPR